ncbi:MAG: hypothetical protein M1820_002520 [Bogoriella megaspora]|nr:MAG: hypothetical protein M1820_002520 [Bogoriella megaspora]
MASATTTPNVGPDTPIAVKVLIDNTTRRFKIPLSNLTATVLPEKLRYLLDIPSNQSVKFERYSDSAGAFVHLEPNNAAVYKTLQRAAKAKLKLRVKATLLPTENNTDETKQPSIPGSFVQPPSPPARTITAPPPTGGVTQWATMMPAIVSSQQDQLPPKPVRGSPPVPPKHSPIGVSQPAISPLYGEDALRARRSRQQFFAELSEISHRRDLALRLKDAGAPAPAVNTNHSWSVYCNACDKPMAHEHFHCSICDDGDYDLCQECVSAGKVCPGQNHWLIKRVLKDGRVVTSTTEKIHPKSKPQSEASAEKEKEMPGAFTEEPKSVTLPTVLTLPPTSIRPLPTRTCNSCVKGMPLSSPLRDEMGPNRMIVVFSEKNFVHCTTCEDYDLCMSCIESNKHGHHPAHEFKPVDEQAKLGTLVETRCRAGRGTRHAATCDSCDKTIFGVRHKCLNCPDYDLCSECFKGAQHFHNGHRFAPLYETLSAPRSNSVRHYGIYCDGPMCSSSDYQTYISGIRYKCAVCHDFDLCANCEAHPSNKHNSTHPMIKFKSPVRGCTVTTMDDKAGSPARALGDQPARRSTGTVTIPAPAVPHPPSEPVITDPTPVADMKPTDESASKADASEYSKKIVMPSPRKQSQDLEPVSPKDSELNAHFIRDTIPDGSTLVADERFTQVWTLRNPGPHAWPAGCSVRYVGGDNMLNVDHSHPASAAEIAAATESNTVERPINIGEEVSFRVLMKAPKREGKAISYWRLKAPNGTPFGHRLWCDINVLLPRAVSHESALFPGAPAELGGMTEHIEYAGPSSRVPPPPMPTVSDPLELFFKTLASRKAQQCSSSDQVDTKAVPEASSPKKGSSETTTRAQETESEDSTMIFPRLEKESPVPSVHEAASPVATSASKEETTVSEPTPSEPSATTESEKPDVFEDVAEDLESLEIESNSDDDGFVTDEEYDILDASDEELPQNAQKMASK